MKSLTTLMSLLLAFALFAAACGSDDVVTNEASQPDPTSAPTTESTTDPTGEPDGERIETLWVGPQLTNCVGEAVQKCMLIKRTADGQAEYIYDAIEGFEHEVGTSYQIKVAVTDVEDPPADASSLSYRLVEVVESTVEPDSAELDGTWTLLGFRDGDLFDAVPDDVDINATFDGASVNGSAGCNSFMGSFTVDDGVLTFGPLASTRMMCPPQVMEHEDRFLAAMATVETAELTFDGTLVLAPASGLTLVFAPANS